MKETLVICASHPRTRALFDFTREDCDIWIFNEAFKTETNSGFATRADGVFQLHIPTIWRNPNNRNDPKHYDWLKSGDTPTVFMQEQYPDVPKSVRFPRDEIINSFANGKANGKVIREVSCSPSWALAYGIYLGYKRIEIYGVELESNTEYSYQQGNFKYWMGVAVGRGIDVNIYSSMFDNPQYGYEGEVEIPYPTFAQRLETIQPHYEVAKQKYNTLAIVSTQRIKEFGEGDNSKELLQAIQDQAQAAWELGNIEGAIQVNQYYKDKADAMIKTGGNFAFSRQEFEQNMAKAKAQAGTVQAAYNAVGGQLEMIHASVVNSAKGSPKREKNLEIYKTTVNKFLSLANQLAGWMGAAQENGNYMARLDAGIKAAGGEKSEQVILEAK